MSGLTPTVTATLTADGTPVTTVVSDPNTNVGYTFTGGDLTGSPMIGYSMAMSNVGGVPCTITQDPFTVLIPAGIPDPFVGTGVTSTQYYSQCIPGSQTSWYVQFSFNTATITAAQAQEPGPGVSFPFFLGTTDFYITSLASDGTTFSCDYARTGHPQPAASLAESSIVTVRFQFVNGSKSVIINNVTLSTVSVSGNTTPQHVVFLSGGWKFTTPPYLPGFGNPDLTLTGIVIGLPPVTFTPTLQYLNSSSELLPYLSTVSGSVVSFTTPGALVNTGSNPSTIVIDQVYSNTVQATASYVITQTGTVADPYIVTTPAFPSSIRIRELVPFSYSFSTTNYYAPPDSIQTYTSVGATPVTITGTDKAVISIPAGFTDAQVLGDRKYNINYLYANNIQLSIDVPFLTSPVDLAQFGLTGGFPIIATVTGGGSGSNTVTLGSSVTYTSPRTLKFVVVKTVLPAPPGLLTFNLYVVNSGGTSNFLFQVPPAPTFTSYSFTMTIQNPSGYAGGSLTGAFNGPSNTQVYPGAPLPLVLDAFASGTSLLTNYAYGQYTQTLLVSSTLGFTSLTVVPLLWKVNAIFENTTIVSVQSLLTVLQGQIIPTPDITTASLQTYIYTPFSYVFSLNSVPNTTLISYNSDPSIRPYITSNYNSTVLTFSSTVGFVAPVTNGLLLIQAVGTDGGVLAETNLFVTASGNVITSTPAFTGNITLYKYEPFSYVYGIVPGVVGLTLSAAASSAEVRTFTTIPPNKLSVTYAGTYKTSYANIVNLIITALNGSNATVSSLSNAVTVNPGRFYNPTSNVFSFYQYEDVAVTYGSNIAFDTAASLDNPPGATPSLPTGLYFASVAGSSNNFVLKGVPQFQTPSNQYLILGVNSVTNQTVTSKITAVVNPARIKITPASLAVSGMQIGVPIQPVTFTSIQPSALTVLNFQYDWDTLPDGLVFQDLNGATVTQPFYPPDANLSIVLAGTPTSNAAYALANSGSSVYSINLYAFQYQPKGVKTNQTAVLTFAFGETVLFDNVTVPKLYATQPLTRTTLVLRAQSYFPADDPIISITAPVLPDGLSIVNTLTGIPNFVNGVDYAAGVFVFGTPTTVSSAIYPITATSLNGYTGVLNLSIPILPDVVSFTSVTPPSATFIVSRPIALDYSLVFTAVSVILGQTITYTTSLDLTNYGVNFIVSNGSATITGTPTFSLPSTTVVITATDTLGTFATVPIQLTIESDHFTFNNPVLNFIQHVPITPVQFSATTTSGRQIVSFGSVNLTAGLSLSILGKLTGTPTNSFGGFFYVTASTGYPPGGIGNFTYSMITDNILTLLTTNPLTIPSSTFSVDAFRSFTYSGNTASVAVDQTSIKDKNGNSATSRVSLSVAGTYLNGTFVAGAQAYSPFSFNVIATYLNTTKTLSLTLYYNGSTGSLTTNVSAGPLKFTSPSSKVYLFYQHCPIPPITFRISGASGFTYFYTITGNLPVGLAFTPDPSGTFATLSGTPALFNDSLVPVTVYAVYDGYITFETIQIRVITPFFVNPQDNGASAYTSILRNQVTVNGAQNARDSVVFPATDASLGFLQSPGAPDVNSPPVPCCEPKHK